MASCSPGSYYDYYFFNTCFSCPAGTYSAPPVSTTTSTYPPSALTSATTALSDGGKYVASASSNYAAENPWKAFNKNDGLPGWTTSTASYNNNGGLYLYSTYSTSFYKIGAISKTSVYGEWLQIQMPSPTVIVSYSMAYNAVRHPKDYTIAGSNDGTTWYEVVSQTSEELYLKYMTIITPDTPQSRNAYTYFRIIVKSIEGNSTSTFGYCIIKELYLNGYRSPVTSCTSCPAGTYSTGGAFVCTKCLAGKYSSNVGATSSSTCQTCSAGTYSTGAASSCTTCPTGTKSSAGASSCSCPAGNYVLMGSATGCGTCPFGTYSSTDGSFSCTSCIGGTITLNTGSTSINDCICPSGQLKDSSGICIGTICQAGYYGQLNSSLCTPCSNGTYNSYTGKYGIESCLSCVSGMTSNPGASSASSCFSCLPGMYSTNTTISYGSCTRCSSLRQTSELNSSSNNYICTYCPPGTYAYTFTVTDWLNWVVFSPPAADVKTIQTGITECIGCSEGTYSSTQGSLTCTQCPAGTYSLKYMATSNTVCTPCLAGTYSNAGATSCTPCPVNTYSNTAGSGSCTQCSPGFFNNDPGSTECTGACDPGQYLFQNQWGSFCLECPRGSISKYASTSCTLCPAGTYYAGISLCFSCPLGTYSNVVGATYNTCQPCPVGSTPNKPEAATSCGVCPAGTIYKNTYGNPYCEDCPSGTYNPSTGHYNPYSGQYSCFPCDTSATPPQYSDTRGATSCKTCSSDYPYYDSVERECYSFLKPGLSSGICRLGYEKINDTTCQKCPTGTYLGVNYCYTDICTFGYGVENGVCKICPAGKYSEGSSPYARQRQVQCLSCAAGTYSASPGSTSCTECPPRTASAEGSTFCLYCPAHTYESNRKCIPCPAGSVFFGTGATSASACQFCSEGFYANGDAGCKPCKLGTFTDSTEVNANGFFLSNASGSCKLCAAGTYQNTLTEPCKPCPVGTYSTIEGMTSSDPYDLSIFIPGISGYTLSKTRINGCASCPEGTYNSGPGATSCTSCPEGTYSTSLRATSASQCLSCPVGTYSTTIGAAACISCLPGTYSASPGATSCTSCPEGTYSTTYNAVSSTTCIRCQPGTYSTTTGAYSPTVCKQCPVDTYYTSSTTSSCTPCPPGSISATGSTSPSACTPCSAGTYAMNGSCRLCSGGTYSSTAGSSSCTSCPTPGMYTLPGAKSASDCKLCPTGLYYDYGLNLCTECPMGMYFENYVCKRCEKGFTAPRGSTSSTACIPIVCGPDQYFDLDNNECTFRDLALSCLNKTESECIDLQYNGVNAAKVDITKYVYGAEPITFIDKQVLPQFTQDALTTCTGDCKFIAADFQKETVSNKSQVPYVISTLQSTSEDKAVIVKDSTPIPIVFSNPPGFSMDDFSITGSNINIPVTTQDQSSCADACSANSQCEGFNITIGTNTCEFFNGITDLKYDDSKLSFKKDTIPTTDSTYTVGNRTTTINTIYAYEYRDIKLDNQGSSCADVTACNSDITRVIQNTDVKSFSTTDLSSCDYCPTRTFDRNSQVVTDELGISTREISRIYYQTGTMTAHLDLVENRTYNLRAYLANLLGGRPLPASIYYTSSSYDVTPCDYVINGFFVRDISRKRYLSTSPEDPEYLPDKYTEGYNRCIAIFS